MESGTSEKEKTTKAVELRTCWNPKSVWRAREVGSINYIVYCTWTKLWLRFSVVAVGLAFPLFFFFFFCSYSTRQRGQRSELRKTFWIGCSWALVSSGACGKNQAKVEWRKMQKGAFADFLNFSQLFKIHTTQKGEIR